MPDARPEASAPEREPLETDPLPAPDTLPVGGSGPLVPGGRVPLPDPDAGVEPLPFPGVEPPPVPGVEALPGAEAPADAEPAPDVVDPDAEPTGLDPSEPG